MMAMSLVSFAGEYVSGKLSPEFKLYMNADFSRQDALKLFQGEKITKGISKTVPFRESDGFVDFIEAGGSYKKGNSRVPGLIEAEFTADQEGKILLGVGADWFFECFVNGDNIYSTLQGGNSIHPIGKKNFIIRTPVKKGSNRIVLLVQSGSAGWSAALGIVDPAEVDKMEILNPHPKLNSWVTHASAGTVTVNFMTDAACPGFVDYRPEGTEKWQRSYDLFGGQIRNDSDKHTVKLEDLKYNTVYEYRPGWIQKNLKEKYGKIRTFRSFTDEAIDFSLFYTSDTQFDFRRRMRCLRDFIKNCKAADADIFVHGGDIDSYYVITDAIIHRTFINVLTAGKRNSQILAVSRGNHEYRGEGSGEFFRYFGGRENKSYYMFRQGNVCFIVLDSGEDKPRIPTDINYYRTFDRPLMKEQRIWLEKAVKTPEFLTAKFRVVFIHSPMTEKYMAESEKILTGGLLTGKNAPHKIHLWVCGHTHRYARTMAPGKKELRIENLPAAISGRSPFVQNSLLVVNSGVIKEWDGSGIFFQFRENEIDIKAMTPDGKVFDHFSVFPDGSLKEHSSTLKLVSVKK